MVLRQSRKRTQRDSSIEPPLPGKETTSAVQYVNREHVNQQRNDSKTVSKLSILKHIVAFDRKFSAWVHEHGLGMFFYVFLRSLEFSGDGLFLITCAAATYVAPKSKLTPEVRIFFFNLFMAYVFDMIFVSIVKKIVRRPRPVYNRNHFLTMQVDHWSFPSGHSTRALLVYTTFWLYIPMWRDQSHRSWLPYLQQKLERRVNILNEFVPTAEAILINLIASIVTGWAIATMSSRIILGRHFFCDVVAGALLGVIEAVFAYYFLTIPIGTSEAVHRKITGAFGWVENSTSQIFHGKKLLVHEMAKR